MSDPLRPLFGVLTPVEMPASLEPKSDPRRERMYEDEIDPAEGGSGDAG